MPNFPQATEPGILFCFVLIDLILSEGALMGWKTGAEAGGHKKRCGSHMTECSSMFF